jgi:multiple sugar transport system substrate-binding protein
MPHEFPSFLYMPFVWSGGGDIMSPDQTTADGYLNSEEAIAALEAAQRWHTEGYTARNEDDACFQEEGRCALSMVGHWVLAQYQEAFEDRGIGDELIALPLPNFGEGTRTGMGSFVLAANSESDADAVWEFIEFALSPEQVARYSEATGGIPARQSVAEESELYRDGALLEQWPIQSEGGYAQTRPTHPGYPTISAAFGQVIDDMIDGASVRELVDEAVDDIDSDLADNDGYPEPEF